MLRLEYNVNLVQYMQVTLSFNRDHLRQTNWALGKIRGFLCSIFADLGKYVYSPEITPNSLDNDGHDFLFYLGLAFEWTEK